MDRYWQGNGMEDMVPAAMSASQCGTLSDPMSSQIVLGHVNKADFL